ncbi:MAG TPA: mechanosensitive ion channel family protein [Planctomycetes bacterium]|nr:mechanosensitive ion channel family protein [Planctomycetota bacterium]HIL37471.1 mechanosensitive ion channel family protein [Planctomycetota bacterium]
MNQTRFPLTRLALLLVALLTINSGPAGAQPTTPWQDAPNSEAAADSGSDEAEGTDSGADLEESPASITDDPGAFLTNLKTQGVSWFKKDGLAALGKLALFLGLLLLTRLAAGLVSRLVDRALSASRLGASSMLQRFAVNSSRRVMLFLGFLLALSTVGISIAPFLAAFGVIGFVVGFALQETMSNFAAGVMILLYQPFDIGDVVSAGGVTGKINGLSLVNTTFLTGDNQTILVPNGKIWGNTITNTTANDTRRVDLTASISYEDSIEQAEKVLRKLCADHPLILAEPETVVRVGNLGDSSVDLQVRPWAKAEDFWTVHFDLLRGIKDTLDQEGISMPYPQRALHIVGSTGANLPPK